MGIHFLMGSVLLFVVVVVLGVEAKKKNGYEMKGWRMESQRANTQWRRPCDIPFVPKTSSHQMSDALFRLALPPSSLSLHPQIVRVVVVFGAVIVYFMSGGGMIAVSCDLKCVSSSAGKPKKYSKSSGVFMYDLPLSLSLSLSLHLIVCSLYIFISSTIFSAVWAAGVRRFVHPYIRAVSRVYVIGNYRGASSLGLKALQLERTDDNEPQPSCVYILTKVSLLLLLLFCICLAVCVSRFKDNTKKKMAALSSSPQVSTLPRRSFGDTHNLLVQIHQYSSELHQRHRSVYHQQHQGVPSEAQQHQQAVELYNDLLAHFRYAMQVASSLLKEHEGILWDTDSSGAGQCLVGDGSTLRLVPPPTNGERVGSNKGSDTVPPLSSEEAQQQCHEVLEVLEGLAPVESAIQSFLPVTLQGALSPAFANRSNDSSRSLHLLAETLTPDEALRTALVLHGKSLLLRDAYLLWSLLHLTPTTTPAAALTDDPAAMEEARRPVTGHHHRRRRLAQGLLLLKQCHQAIDAYYLSTSVLTLLLPYSDARTAFAPEEERQPPSQHGGVRGVVDGSSSVEQQLYAKVVQHTKTAYKTESRISAYCHELTARWRTEAAAPPSRELRQFVVHLMEEFNILRGAKNELQLCVLQAHAGALEASQKRGRKAVQILFALCRQYSGSLLAVDAGGVIGQTTNATEIQAFVLLPVALYNLACTIDRVARRKAVYDPGSRGNPERRESRDMFFQAYRLAEQFLGPQHELVKELTRVFGAARLERWQQRVQQVEAAKANGSASRPGSHPGAGMPVQRYSNGNEEQLYLSSSSTSANSFGNPPPPMAAPMFPNRKPPHHLPTVPSYATERGPSSPHHSGIVHAMPQHSSSSSFNGSTRLQGAAQPPPQSSPGGGTRSGGGPAAAHLLGSSLVSGVGGAVPQGSSSTTTGPFKLFSPEAATASSPYRPPPPPPAGGVRRHGSGGSILLNSPGAARAAAGGIVPQGVQAVIPPPPARTDGGESSGSAGTRGSREAQGNAIQFLNRSMSSLASGMRGSLGRRGSMRSVLSSLRSSHRLEKPDDALSLGGPTPEFIPPNPTKEEEARREKEAAEQRKRERRIRTFIPEEVEAKKKKKEAKLARQRKRERHERKKEQLAKREQARAAAAEAEALVKATEAYYAHLDKQVPDDADGALSSPASHDLHGASTADVHEQHGTGLLTAAASTTAHPTDPTLSGDALVEASNGGHSFLADATGETEDDGITGKNVPPLGTAEAAAAAAAKKKKKKKHTDEEGNKAAAGGPVVHGAGFAGQLSASTSAVVLHDPLHTARPGYDGAGPFAEEELSSLSSSSLPASSTDNSDDEEFEDDAAGETVSERKDRYDIEMQIYFLCLHRKRHMAACVLQRAWRSSVARLELYNRRQFLYSHLYKQQKAAALCIVGFMRSMLTRKHLQKRIEARKAADMQRQEQERQEISAVKVLEGCFSRYLTRKHHRDRLRKELNLERDARLSKYETAAIIVQRWWRIIPEVRAYWARRRVEVEEERLLREAEERRETAATLLQARVRGMQTRRYVRRFKAQRSKALEEQRRKLVWSTDLVKLALTEWCLRVQRLDREARQAEQREYEAVDAISQGWHNALARRRFELALAKARQIRNAAQTIQRAFKKHYAARERRYLRELSYTAEKERVDREFIIFRATLRLQCFARMVLAKAVYRRQRARYGRGVLYALTVLQSVGRGCLARRQFNAARLAEYEARRVAAETAESVRQRHLAVLQAWFHSKASAVLKERKACQRLYDKLFIRRLVRQELRREKAAVTIQRQFRRYLQERNAFYADYQEQCAESAALMAVVKIQCAWRQWLARKELRRLRWFAFKASQQRLEKEDVLAAQWLTDVHFFLGEFDHARRRIVNLESDMRDTLQWIYSKETKALQRKEGMLAATMENEDDETPPMNVTAALEGYLNKEYLKKWGALYDEDEEEGEA
eukprot:gene9531-6689_t